MNSFMHGFANELTKVAAPGLAPPPISGAKVPAPTLAGFKPGGGAPPAPKPKPAAVKPVKPGLARGSGDAPKGWSPPSVPKATSAEGGKRLAKARAAGQGKPQLQSAAQRLEAKDKAGTLGAWPGAKKTQVAKAPPSAQKMERARKKLMAKGTGRREATNRQYRTTSEKGRRGTVGVGEQASQSTKEKTRDELAKTKGRRSATNMFYRTTSATGRAGKAPRQSLAQSVLARKARLQQDARKPAQRNDSIARAGSAVSSIADKVKSSVTGWADEQRRKRQG